MPNSPQFDQSVQDGRQAGAQRTLFQPRRLVCAALLQQATGGGDRRYQPAIDPVIGAQT